MGFLNAIDPNIQRSLFWIIVFAVHFAVYHLDKKHSMKEQMKDNVFVWLKVLIFFFYALGGVELIVIAQGKPSFLFH